MNPFEEALGPRSIASSHAAGNGDRVSCTCGGYRVRILFSPVRGLFWFHAFTASNLDDEA